MHIIIFLALTLSASPPSDKRARSRVAQSRGQIAFRSGDLKKALEHFSRATTLDSAYGEPWYWLGVTCERLGRLKQAEKALLTAVELGEPQVALLKLLGSIQVRLKKFSWAMRTLSGARELSPKDHEVAVLLAYCLVFTEEYDDAAKLLREVLARGSRATKERARVLLGILHYRMKKLARARMVLSRGEEFSSLKSRILSLIVKKELGIKRGIGGTLSFSLGFDSNPALNADPDRSLITTGDGGLVSTLSAYMWMHPTDALATELSVVRTFYAAPWDQKTHDRIASFNMTLLEAGAFYRYRYLSDRGQHRRLEAGYIFSLTALDGGEGIPSEPDPFLFSEKHSLLLSYHRAPHKDQSMDFSVTPSYTAFRDQDRDALDLRASLKWSLFYQNSRYKVFPLFYGGGKKAAWDPWSSWYMGLWLGFSTLGPAKTDITAYLSWQTELFPLSGTASTGYSSPLWGLSGDQYRQDNLLGAALSLSRSFLKGNIRASITARYTKNQSNAQYFDYDRFSLVFSVSGKLDRDWEKP